MLHGRQRERAILNGLLDAVRRGESRALVIEGEPGVGKSALLAYLHEQASECLVTRAAGVQSEMELAYAGLHQLCAPFLDRLDRLPGPQRDALATAFGLARGDAPDRFFVGLAVLSLLAEVADERPFICLIDDAQWLDRASAETLGFVGRRLLAESVALVFAVRDDVGQEALAGLPQLRVEGLPPADAHALLRGAMTGRLDERVADRIVAETRGNPLALLELPRGLSTAQLAGGFGLPDASSLSGHIEGTFQRRLEALPQSSRQLLLIAAAEPVGDPSLVWRAAQCLGIEADAAAPATAADLLTIGADVRFRHPLVRSAVYRAATPAERRAAHAALAQATDAESDPDRRAWHRAQAAAGRDETVAAELEHSAGRARARGGIAAAAAFLERAVELTADPAQRTRRALAAAQGAYDAGASDTASALLTTAERAAADELDRARVERLRARIALTQNRGSAATEQFLRAARRLEPLDAALARKTYVELLEAAMTVGGREAILEGMRALERTGGFEWARPNELLPIGWALMFTEGFATARPIIKRALDAFADQPVFSDDELRSLDFASGAGLMLWDDERAHVLAVRQVSLVRDAGALTLLPGALEFHAGALVRSGRLDAAQAALDEAETITEVTGGAPYLDAALLLAGWRGDEAAGRERIERAIADATLRGEETTIVAAECAGAILFNALGRHDDALGAAQRSCAHHPAGTYVRALIELVEAGARCGAHDEAATALEGLRATTSAAGTDWALGIEVRSRALLSDGPDADRLYREAIERLGRTRLKPELARAHLLYGEWLRRGRRRVDARTHLRTAHELFAASGTRAFADRAARELLATGETARKRAIETRSELTAQEAQVARLARDGLSNPEIGARLFISPRTVQYHLHKVFTKLDISSRAELELALGVTEREHQRAG